MINKIFQLFEVEFIPCSWMHPVSEGQRQNTPVEIAEPEIRTADKKINAYTKYEYVLPSRGLLDFPIAHMAIFIDC